MATPSLLAQIISSKMHYGLPLYRQEQLFNQAGIELSRQTTSRWLISCAEKLKPLLALMKAELLKQPVLWADETTVNVLDVEKKHLLHVGIWLWLRAKYWPQTGAV